MVKPLGAVRCECINHFLAKMPLFWQKSGKSGWSDFVMFLYCGFKRLGYMRNLVTQFNQSLMENGKLLSSKPLFNRSSGKLCHRVNENVDLIG